MNISKILLPICLLPFLGGCGEFGWWWSDLSVKPITPSRDNWVKPGMTEDGRTADWVACEGRADGEYTWDPNNDDKIYDIYRCMIKRNYRFTGKCYDNAISRDSPACQHRAENDSLKDSKK